jgi:hypothetical protein
LTFIHAPRAARRVLIVAASLCLMLGYTAMSARTASATATCEDGKRASAAAIAGDYDKRDHKQNTIPEPVKAGLNGDADNKTVVKLRYAEAPYHCVWALIADPHAVARPGLATTAWIDRRHPGQSGWDGPLGRRDIQAGNGTTYTAAFNISGYEARACGVWGRSSSVAHCTAWFSEPAPSTPAAGQQAGGGTGSRVPAVGHAPLAPSSTQALAQRILDLAGNGTIALSDHSDDTSADTGDRSLPRLQLQDIAAGKPAHLSTHRPTDPKQKPAYCSYAMPRNTVQPDIRVLQFLADLGQAHTYTITALFGLCHSGASSSHHLGQAVDFGCPISDTTLSSADTIGKKYGILHNYEQCSNKGHWHYSIGGR